jgi:hypothetical protein
MYAGKIDCGEDASVLLELPWDGAVTVGTVGRQGTFGSVSPPTITSSSGDGSRILCTAATGADRAAKIAAVAASSNGSLYYQDTAANSVFVRHVPTPRATGEEASYTALPETNSEKVNRSTYIVLRV